MNADSRKPEIANAQTYFAAQTRKQELTEETLAMMARLEKRHLTGVHLRQLNDVAKDSGVEHFGVFHDRGNTALYSMQTREVKAKKGIPQNETILDYAGIAELSAIDFKNTQTATVLDKLKIRSEVQAIIVHEKVGRNVRKAIKESNSIMPEDLPAESHIKVIEKTVKATKELPPKSETAMPLS
jgi:DNA-damage-inducible protein D